LGDPSSPRFYAAGVDTICPTPLFFSLRSLSWPNERSPPSKSPRFFCGLPPNCLPLSFLREKTIFPLLFYFSSPNRVNLDHYLWPAFALLPSCSSPPRGWILIFFSSANLLSSKRAFTLLRQCPSSSQFSILSHRESGEIFYSFDFSTF